MARRQRPADQPVPLHQPGEIGRRREAVQGEVDDMQAEHAVLAGRRRRRFGHGLSMPGASDSVRRPDLLTTKFVGGTSARAGAGVIDDPAAASVSLDPVRARLLAELAEPGSASSLAAKVGLPRQKVNYHLRTLEQHGLVELVRGAPPGQHDRAGHAGHRGQLRDLPGRARRSRPGPVAGAGPALGPLADRGGRAHGPRGRRAAGRRDRGREAAGHVRRWKARCGSRRPPTGRRLPQNWPMPSPRWSASTTTSSAPHGRPHRVVVAVHPATSAEEDADGPRTDRRASSWTRHAPSRCGRPSPPGRASRPGSCRTMWSRARAGR